jgi:hypothetical protein
VFDGDPTNGTLGIALADLNGDKRIDVVHAQGEVENALAEKVFFGKSIAPDTCAPWIGALDVKQAAAGGPVVVRVRVHDRKSPCMPHDWQNVVLRCSRGEKTKDVPLVWYGEYLWRASVPAEIAGEKAGRVSLTVVATDAAGNTATSSAAAFDVR